MIASSVLLTTSKISVLDVPSQLDQNNETNFFLACTLKWRQGKLWVHRAEPDMQLRLPALSSKEWLKNCLRTSTIQAVCLDPNLSQEELRFWADMCKQTNKLVFLQVPSTPELPQKHSPLGWRVKRVIDWIAAIGLLGVLSPLLLGLGLLIWISSPGPIFSQQWRIGRRGKLFRIINFRTVAIGTEKLADQKISDWRKAHRGADDPHVTGLGRWMRKYNLDRLPQLINVLRGEMSLVGPCPWALSEVVQIHSEVQQQLNAMPGIIGVWQTRSPFPDPALSNISAVNHLDLEYLRTWSLQQDCQILLLSILKMFSGVAVR